MVNGEELLEREGKVIHLVLEQCSFCAIGFVPEDLSDFEDHRLCDDCRKTHIDQLTGRKSEREFQAAMNKLPTDELLTLRWMLSIAYQQVQDKNNCDNIHRWNNRISEAIASKSDSRQATIEKTR